MTLKLSLQQSGDTDFENGNETCYICKGFWLQYLSYYRGQTSNCKLDKVAFLLDGALFALSRYKSGHMQKLFPLEKPTKIGVAYYLGVCRHIDYRFILDFCFVKFSFVVVFVHFRIMHTWV